MVALQFNQGHMGAEIFPWSLKLQLQVPKRQPLLLFLVIIKGVSILSACGRNLDNMSKANQTSERKVSIIIIFPWNLMVFNPNWKEAKNSCSC